MIILFPTPSVYKVQYCMAFSLFFLFQWAPPVRAWRPQLIQGNSRPRAPLRSWGVLSLNHSPGPVKPGRGPLASRPLTNQLDDFNELRGQKTHIGC
jgi:hypothetical protein